MNHCPLRFGFSLILFYVLVAVDFAVEDVEDTMRVLGNVMFMSDKDDGIALPVKFIKQTHNFMRSLRVKVSGRFVCQNY